MTMLEAIVIIGGGLAGANAAFALRERGFDGRVALIGEEQQLPYERPPMSKEYLRGEKTLEESLVRPADQYAESSIELIAGVRAEAIDTVGRAVVLADKRKVRYDALLLATGAAARRLGVPGADLTGVHYLRNVDDADVIRDAAREADRVAVIGGGWIGTEVAASLRQLGSDVTLIAPPPQPLERVLGAEVADVYRQLHEENGTRLVTGRVARIGGGRRVGWAELEDGSRVAADMIVAGVGAAPRVELAHAAGLKLDDGGVKADAHLETSVPGIFAAGDICAAWHPRLGRHVRLEHWDNAIEQGKAAAANMLGARLEYDRTPYFYSDQFDLGMEYRGLAEDWDRVVIRGDVVAREFDAFWLKGGRVVAAMNANRWDDANELQELVDGRALADPDELASPTASAVAAR